MFPRSLFTKLSLWTLQCSERRGLGSQRFIEDAGDCNFQSAIPESIQRRKMLTLSCGHAPSHGIVPFSSLVSISGACRRTSLGDQRSKMKLIDSRSILLNSGLMCCAKPTPSSGPGIAIEGGASSFGATAEALEPGLASQTHHQRGT